MIDVRHVLEHTKDVDLAEDETSIVTHLRHYHPEMVPLFINNLRKGRHGILSRLIQGMIRENLIEPERISGTVENGENIRIHLPSGGVLEVPVGKQYALGRFELDGDMRLIGHNQTFIIDHPVSLLDLLKREGLIPTGVREAQWERFRSEVQNSSANYTLALAGADLRSENLKKKADCPNSLEWVVQRAEQEETFSPLAFYEQWVVDGHTLHPGSKTKFGLSPADVMKYSPEWGAIPEVALVAVHHSYCQLTSLDGTSFTDILYQEYTDLKMYVNALLREYGLASGEYELIPVHPWQLEHTLPALYQQAIQQKKIIWIRGYSIPAAALVSFRSLAPVQSRGQGRHHIKTAINVQTTSAIRTVSPQSTENGPALSAVLREIQMRENHFNQRLILLEERAGIYYRPLEQELPTSERLLLGKNLASILRENPENYVEKGEIPMPGAALINLSPLSGKPVIVELIEQVADCHNIRDLNEAACFFIRKYAAVSLPGFITMMCKYGISLEGHLQNSIPVFRNGQLVRMIVRDYGGVRLDMGRLARQHFTCPLSPGSAIVSEDLADLHNVFSHAIFQNHIGELILCVVSWMGIDERPLWERIIEVCRRIFSELKKDPLIRDQAEEDESSLFAPFIGLKALVTMRLFDDITSYSYAMVENPLYTKGGK